METILASGSWNTSAAIHLASRWGVLDRQIWKDRKTVLERWKAQVTAETRDDSMSRLLMEMRMLRGICVRSGDGRAFMTAEKLFKLEAEILGLLNGPVVQVNVGVELLDPASQARQILEALPMALQVLGMTIPDNLPIPPRVGQVLDVDIISPEE